MRPHTLKDLLQTDKESIIQWFIELRRDHKNTTTDNELMAGRILDLSKAVDRLQDNVVQLSAELRQKDGSCNKAVVPQVVADAIDWFKSQEMSNEEIYELSQEPSGNKYVTALNAWVDGGGGLGDDLMVALINGYTIEESSSVEDKLRDSFEKLMKHYNTKTGIPIDALATVLTVETRKILAEHKQIE